MKILILSDANSIHTQRWVESLKLLNFDIMLFTLFKPNKKSNKKFKQLGIETITSDLKLKINNLRSPNLSKLKYIQAQGLIKKTIKSFCPDLIHAHYASSYGLLAYLSRFRPYIVSAWGSDIYDFPEKNFINRFLLKLVLCSANEVCSTSVAMSKEIKNLFKNIDVNIIPFGIDSNIFVPNKTPNKKFVVGTIKSIEEHNGIDCIVEAARNIIYKYKKEIDFLIVGSGSLEKKMKEKVKKYNLNNNFKFTGFVPHENVKEYYHKLSIFIAVSTRESFGVSILEAAGCEIPSITSNVGGLNEVNINNETGIIINADDPHQLAESIVKLYEKDSLRKKFGFNARKNVIENFNWNDNVNSMISLYEKFIT